MRSLTPAEEANLPWNDECRSAVAVFLKRFRDTGQPYSWRAGWMVRGPEGESDRGLIWRPSVWEMTPISDKVTATLEEPNAIKRACHDLEHCLYLVDAALSGQPVPKDVKALIAEAREFFDDSWDEFTDVNAACEAFYFWMSEETLKERYKGDEPEEEEDGPL